MYSIFKESLLSNGLKLLYELFATRYSRERHETTHNAAGVCNIKVWDCLQLIYHVGIIASSCLPNFTPLVFWGDIECAQLAGPGYIPTSIITEFGQLGMLRLRKFGYCPWSKSRLDTDQPLKPVLRYKKN